MKAHIMYYMVDVPRWRDKTNHLILPREEIYMASFELAPVDTPILWFLFSVNLTNKGNASYMHLHAWSRSLLDEFFQNAFTDAPQRRVHPIGIGERALGFVFHVARYKLLTQPQFIGRIRDISQGFQPNELIDQNLIQTIPFYMFAMLYKSTHSILRQSFGLDRFIYRIFARDEVSHEHWFSTDRKLKSDDNGLMEYMWPDETHVVVLDDESFRMYAQAEDIVRPRIQLMCDYCQITVATHQSTEHPGTYFCGSKCYKTWKEPIK